MQCRAGQYSAGPFHDVPDNDQPVEVIDSRGASTLILSYTEEVGQGGSWCYCESCYFQHGCSSMDAFELGKVQIQVEGVAVEF